MTSGLGEHERRLLLRVARDAVTASVTDQAEAPASEDVIGNGGAFVTLRVRDALRGCIGQVEQGASLVQTVAHVATAAATADPRFPPVRPDELRHVTFEVSVLGPLEPCSGPQSIEVGRHGVVVDDGARRGLLLPQVAVEWGWDSHTFVSQTCIKAGLEPDAWQHNAQLFRFEADVFSEGDAG